MVWRLRATEPGASSAGGGRFAVASHLDLQQVFAQDHRAAEPRLGGLNPHLFGDLQIIGRHEVRQDEHLDAGPFGDSPGVLG